MKAFRTPRIVIASLGLIGALAVPSQAVVGIGADTTLTASAEFRGTIRSVTLPALVIGVTSVSGDNLAAALRVYKDRDITLTTDTATTVRRDDRTTTLASLRAGDVVRAWARCTLVTANNSTTANCRAYRIHAWTPQPPKPTMVVATGVVSARTPTSLTITPSRVDADSRGRSVEAAIKAARTLSATIDSKTLARLADTTVPIDLVAIGGTVRLHASCLTTAPYPCTATRIDILTPKTEKVIMVGKVTAVTATTITLGVMSVVHHEDDAIDVQALHDQALTVTVPKGTSVRKAGRSTSLSGIALGTQVTVRAHCQLASPFACVAYRVTVKA